MQNLIFVGRAIQELGIVMVNKLDCVSKVLFPKYTIALPDQSNDFLEADILKFVKEKKVYLWIDLRYDKKGLTFEKISESKKETYPELPSYSEDFEDKTKSYVNTPLIDGLRKSINDDIQKNCS